MQELYVMIRKVERLAYRRRLTALVLRQRGWTLARIGKKLGVSRQRVGQMVGKR